MFNSSFIIQMIKKWEAQKMSEGILKLGRYLGLVSIGKNIDFSLGLFYIVGFLITRSNPGGFEIPIAAIWYIVGSITGRSKILLALVTLIGTFSAFSPVITLQLIITIILFEIIQNIIQIKQDNLFNLFPLVFLSIVIPGLIITFINGGFAYEVVSTILKCISAIWFLVIFQKAFEAFESFGEIKNQIEIVPALAITIIIILSGTVDFTFFDLSSMQILFLLGILLCSYIFGPAAGCIAGIASSLFLGDVNSIVSVNSLIPAFCGLLSGFYSKKNRLITAFVFIFSYLLFSSSLGSFNSGIDNMAEIIVAVAIFSFIPIDKLLRNKLQFLTKISDEIAANSSVDALKITASQKLLSFSHAMQEVSKIIKGVDAVVLEKEKEGLNNLFDTVADRICKDCSLCLHCWEKSFYSTYQAMHAAVEKLEKKGWIDETDIPAYFIERCERMDEFMKTVNSMYEIHKLNTLWKNRLEEARLAMSKQFSEISELISKLSDEIESGIYTRGDIESKINISMKKAGIRSGELTVAQQNEDFFTISICYEENENTTIISEILLEIVTEQTKKEMDYTYKEKSNSQFFKSRIYRFKPKPLYSVSTGVASISKQKNEVSGDTYSLLDDENGKYFLILSDGSGTGQLAASYSKTAVDLTENLIQAGFENSTSVKLINSALMYKSMGEMLSTIDIVSLDLVNLIAEFYKIGAAPSFVKRSNYVEYIPSRPIHLGCEEFSSDDIFKKELEDGDTIIMMSDGAYERLRNRGKDVKSLQEMIKGFKSRNPQELAELLMDEAYKDCRGIINDDMTIMAAKIWKRL